MTKPKIRKTNPDYLFVAAHKNDIGKYEALIGYGDFIGLFENEKACQDYIDFINRMSKRKVSDYKIIKVEVNIYKDKQKKKVKK